MPHLRLTWTRAGARSVWGKDTAYQASFKHPDFDNMFTTTNVAQHDKIKAKLLSPYSGREATAMEPTYVDHPLERLSSCPIQGSSIPRYTAWGKASMPNCFPSQIKLNTLN